MDNSQERKEHDDPGVISVWLSVNLVQVLLRVSAYVALLHAASISSYAPENR